MKENCLDIGIIQAFLDSELTHDERKRVSGHIAICDNCAVMLAEAEDQSAVVFSALEREFNTLVPTQRLWNKINDSIAIERESRPFWQKAYAFVAMAFANPSITAVASLLIVVGVFAAVWMNRTPVSNEVAIIETPVKTGATNTPVFSPPETNSGDVVNDRTPQPIVRFERAAYRSDSRPGLVPPIKTPNTSNGYMPGEESYIKTISSLTKTVEEQKAGGIMRPGERIAYERDMAVVNDAIAKLKKEVKRNPRNESAKQVLYSSYQNKIDLLNSVSQKEELMASIR